MEEHRDSQDSRQDGRGKSGKSKNVQHDAGNPKRYEGIDYDQLQIDAAHYLQVYDTEIIYSWTPREFRNFIKGARLQDIDEIEKIAISAIFVSKAKNKKRINGVKDIYDAEKARKEMLKGTTKAEPLYLERHKKASKAMETYNPIAFEQKGG